MYMPKVMLTWSENFSLWSLHLGKKMSSATASEEHPTSKLAYFLKILGTERLIKFLQRDEKLRDIELGDKFFTKLNDEKITGHLFLKLTRQEFREFGELEDYIKELGE